MQNDSYNRGGFIAFLFAMVFSLGFFVYVVFIHPGVNLREIPEQKIASTDSAGAASAQSTEVDVSKIAKPWEPSEEMVQHGKKVFASACAACHGETGAGDGPAGKALNPPPRNFIEGKWKKGGDSKSLFETIKNGISGTSMAPFGGLPLADRWGLVQYVRSITKNLVKDNPTQLEEFGKTAN